MENLRVRVYKRLASDHSFIHRILVVLVSIFAKVDAFEPVLDASKMPIVLGQFLLDQALDYSRDLEHLGDLDFLFESLKPLFKHSVLLCLAAK